MDYWNVVLRKLRVKKLLCRLQGFYDSFIAGYV